jgi:hypothetical protein
VKLKINTKYKLGNGQVVGPLVRAIDEGVGDWTTNATMSFKDDKQGDNVYWPYWTEEGRITFFHSDPDNRQNTQYEGIWNIVEEVK